MQTNSNPLLHIVNLARSRHLHPNIHRLRSRYQLYRLWVHTKKQNSPKETRKTPDSQQCGWIPK